MNCAHCKATISGEGLLCVGCIALLEYAEQIRKSETKAITENLQKQETTERNQYEQTTRS